MTDQLFTEQAVLGAALHGPRGLAGIMSLDERDFTTHRHRRIAAALQWMAHRDLPADVITLQAALESRGGETAGDRVTSSYLHTLYDVVPVPENGLYYAAEVRNATRARMIGNLAANLADRKGSDDLESIVAAHQSALAELPPPLGEDIEDIPTIAELFDKTFENRWLLPGLMHRRDRIVITGAEGLAKSTVSTQFAISLAAGLHPWTGVRFGEGLRVLLIDCENDEQQTQTRYRWVGERINALNGQPGWAHRIHHQIRPEGLDLVQRDRAWLSRLIGRVTPDLVVLGPAYKVIGGAKTNEDSAILSFFAVIDELRVKHDCAFLIEAHSGHAKDGDERSVRPFGSSVWLRWPEVGIGMRRNAELDSGDRIATFLDVVPWRGFRHGDTTWPSMLRKGKDHELPWQSYTEGEKYWQTAAARTAEIIDDEGDAA